MDDLCVRNCEKIKNQTLIYKTVENQCFANSLFPKDIRIKVFLQMFNNDFKGFVFDEIIKNYAL